MTLIVSGMLAQQGWSRVLFRIGRDEDRIGRDEDAGDDRQDLHDLVHAVADRGHVLSFIAGLYGMNFDPSISAWNMPELGWRYGYPFALALMAAVGGGFVFYMWRRGWLK